MKLIDNEIFFGLLNNLKIDTRNSYSEQLVIISKFKNYSLSFYMDYDSNACRKYDTLIQDELGTMVFGEWIEYNTNKFQDRLLLEHFANFEKTFFKELDKKNRAYNVDEDFDGDYYFFYGVSRGMFI